MRQTELNAFKRKYCDLSRMRQQGHIVHDPNTSREHRRLVVEICEWLHQNKYIFYTRTYLKGNKIVDIVAPELPYPFIEVRHSEEKKDKEYLEEYKGMTIFVDCSDPFKLL